MGRNHGVVIARRIVAAALVCAHRGIELFAIEAGGDHLMAVIFECRDNRVEQRMIVTLRQRMAVNDLDQHPQDFLISMASSKPPFPRENGLIPILSPSSSVLLPEIAAASRWAPMAALAIICDACLAEAGARERTEPSRRWHRDRAEGCRNRPGCRLTKRDRLHE